MKAQRKDLSYLFYDSVLAENWKKADSLLLIIKTEIENKLYEDEVSFYQGYLSLYKGNYKLAYQYFLISKEFYEKQKNYNRLADTESHMLDCIIGLANYKIDPLPLINSICNIANKSDFYYKSHCEFYRGIYEENYTKNLKRALFHYKNSSELILQDKDTLGFMTSQINVAYLTGEVTKNYTGALQILNSIEEYYLASNEDNKSNLFAIKLFQAEQFKNLKNYTKALYKLREASNYLEFSSDLNDKIALNVKFANIYEQQKVYQKSLEYTKIAQSLKDSLNQNKISKEIEEMQVKQDLIVQEKINLESETKRLKTQNIALGLGGGLLGVTIIAFLVYKNTKRKQRIAEQERELEITKTEKILKEQELTTIDAMISGQEKERQRLASDLHDSVGATLAAAKLQFDHLTQHKDRLHNLDELFTKTGNLLDDAYNEVRTMAHIKNSGVLAKNGLLPALEKLTKNASEANGLTIEVEHFGLEHRLENSLEIAIFRVIQELVTNIIKHAKATEASVTITQHDQLLSIIVEDNGVGFKSKNNTFKDGMGLSSIEKRVEHLEGTLEVDSTPRKGTSVLIDIPL